jgi:hypothetical protein
MKEITIGGLHDALGRVEGKRPTERLIAAIASKNRITQTERAK